MRKSERLRYEMLLRVRDFGVNHRQQFPDGSMGDKAFRAVAASVAGIDAHNTARVLNERGARQARRAAREALVEQLVAIARTARVVSKTVPVSDAMVHAPGRLPDIALLATARAILEESQGCGRFPGAARLADDVRDRSAGTDRPIRAGGQQTPDQSGRCGGSGARHQDRVRAGVRRLPHARRRRHQHAEEGPGASGGVETRSARQSDEPGGGGRLAGGRRERRFHRRGPEGVMTRARQMLGVSDLRVLRLAFLSRGGAVR